MTRFLTYGATLAATACLVGACSLPPNPVVWIDPVPQPPPDYKVKCGSIALPLNAYYTHCKPVRAPARGVVIRAKG